MSLFYMKFELNKLALVQISFRAFRFSLTVSFYDCFILLFY